MGTKPPIGGPAPQFAYDYGVLGVLNPERSQTNQDRLFSLVSDQLIPPADLSTFFPRVTLDEALVTQTFSFYLEHAGTASPTEQDPLPDPQSPLSPAPTGSHFLPEFPQHFALS